MGRKVKRVCECLESERFKQLLNLLSVASTRIIFLSLLAPSQCLSIFTRILFFLFLHRNIIIKTKAFMLSFFYQQVESITGTWSLLDLLNSDHDHSRHNWNESGMITISMISGKIQMDTHLQAPEALLRGKECKPYMYVYVKLAS